jgi:putative transposase
MAVKFSSQCVYQIRYHLVMCVKYRKQLLRRKAYQETLVAWLREIGKRYWYEIEEVGSDDRADQVVGHGLCQIHGFKCAPHVLKKQPCFFNK